VVPAEPDFTVLGGTDRVAAQACEDPRPYEARVLSRFLTSLIG
jgi:hypothetical protein